MLLNKINWKIINYSYLNNNISYLNLMRNLFIDSEIILEYNFNDDIIFIYNIDDKYALNYTKLSFFNLINKENYIDKFNQIFDTVIFFDSLIDIIKFLRKIKNDPAVYYELNDIVSSLISSLYKNKTINIDELISTKK